MTRCNEPISWLKLERLHLEELSAADAEDVRAHLAECERCRLCLDAIVRGDERPLRPLAAPANLVERRPRRRWSFLASVSTLATAAALVLVYRTITRPTDGPSPPRRPLVTAVKGGDITFSLVREDGAVVPEPAFTFRQNDRFHARMTCPPSATLHVGVAVYVGGDVGLAVPNQDVSCANEVDIPGAFQLTGQDEMDLCLVFDHDQPITDSRLRTGAGGHEMLCKKATAVSE